MNFLAHAYLSFGEQQILVGNMISDFVKGKSKFDYADGIQKGINLHRMIDSYTDEHPATKCAKEIFRPAYHLYSAPIIDIVFDHFLATDSSIFNKVSLDEFCTGVYSTLEDHSLHLPNRFLQVLTYMRAENWLFNYSRNEGIERSLRGLVRRSAFLKESDTAFALFKENYGVLKDCFADLLPDVKSYAKKHLEQML